MKKQPTSLEEIIVALKAAIEDTQSNRKDMASKIAYSILYGNNAIDVRQLFLEYPELEAIAELALEFDYEVDEERLEECWKGIKNCVVIVSDQFYRR